jgi:hypothetical protein
MNFTQILQSVAKAETSPLYVCRRLTPESAEQFTAWAKGQGFSKVLAPEELHVTVVYSKSPVDWCSLEEDDTQLIAEAGGRKVTPLGDKGAVVLKFKSARLQARWAAWCACGASWDYENYQPHVTITYRNPPEDLKAIEPYEGPLEFQGEEFEPISEDFADTVVEKFEFLRVLKRNPYHDAAGLFTTKDKAVPKGMAESLYDQTKDSRSPKEIIESALSDPDDRKRYAESLERASSAAENPTHHQHTKNGDGTGGYTAERLKLHKRILDHLFKDAHQYVAEGQPEMTILGGRGGSGKSNFDIRRNPKVGVYDSKNTLVLDSDRIKELLPEYTPSTAAVVHAESSHILHRAASRARAMKMNVALDVTMRSSVDPWISVFKEDGYKVNAAYMHRPAHKAAEQAIERWNKPSSFVDLDGNTKVFDHGRLVPVHVVLSNVHNERNFDRVSRKADSWKLVDHSGEVGKFTVLAESGKKADLTFWSVLKRNPYRDAAGKFTTKDKAGWGGVPQVTAGKDKVKQLFPGSWIHSETEYGNGNGHVLTKHTHIFYSKAKAADAFGKVVQVYADQGLKLSAESRNLKPGEYSADLVNSKIEIKAYKPEVPELDIVKVGPKGVHDGLSNLAAAKAAAKAASGSWVVKDSETAVSLGKDGVMTTHKQIFYSAAKMKEKLPDMQAAYEANGYKQVPVAKNPGEFSVFPQNGSTVSVTAIHKKSDVNTDVKAVDASPAQSVAAPKATTAHTQDAPAKAPAAPPAPAKVVPPPPTPPALPNLTAPGVNPYGETGKLLPAIQTAIAYGDIAKVKYHAENASYYTQAASAYAKSYLKYHEELQAYAKEHGSIGEPTFDGLSPKAKAKAQAAVSEYLAKHEAAAMAAKELSASGKNSAAKAKMAPLNTVEKKMLAAGVSPADIALTKAKAFDNLAAKEESIKQQYKKLSAEVVAQEHKNGVDQSKQWHVYSDQAMELKAKQNQLSAAHPALLSKMSPQRMESDEKAQLKALKSIEFADAHAKANAAKNLEDKIPHAMAASALEKELTNLGAKPEQLKAWTELGAAKALNGKEPATAAEALTLAKAEYKALKDLHNQNHYTFKANYSDPDPVSKAVLTEASAKYIAAKGKYLTLGGDPEKVKAGDKDLKTLETESYKEVEAWAKANKQAKKELKDSLKTAMVARAMAEVTGDTVLPYGKIKAMQQEAKNLKISDSELGYLNDEVNIAVSKQKAELGSTAQSKLHGTAYAYEYAKQMKGRDHPDTLAAKDLHDQTAKVYGKHLTTGLDTIENSAKHSVGAAKKMAEVTKNLAKDMPKVMQDFDAKDADFQYPTTASTDFNYHQKKLVANMSPKAKQILKDYTGSYYKPLNKAVGLYGTQKMKGEHPTALSSEIKKQMKDLDDMFQQTSLGAPVRLRRNMATKYILEQMGLPGSGEGVTEAQVASLVGRVYKETAYSSTSMSPHFSGSFSAAASKGEAVLKIRAPAHLPGLKVTSFGQHGDAEGEVVLGRGTTYVIRKATKSKYGAWEFEVDALGMSPDPL